MQHLVVFPAAVLCSSPPTPPTVPGVGPVSVDVASTGYAYRFSCPADGGTALDLAETGCGGDSARVVFSSEVDMGGGDAIREYQVTFAEEVDGQMESMVVFTQPVSPAAVTFTAEVRKWY